MQSGAKTVSEYLKSLPEERRAALSAVRREIKKNLPEGYKEGMLYGMIGYYIPLSKYPDTYNGQPLAIAGLASQKRHMAVYLMNIYADPKILKWFKSQYKKSGKKLDMGKSCIRFRKLEDLPIKLIGKAVAKTPSKQFIKLYEKSRKK